MTEAPRTARLLTRHQAAELAGVHYNTVRRWERTGQIETQRVIKGGVEVVLIPEDQIQGMMSDREQHVLPDDTWLRERVVALETELRMVRQQFHQLQEEHRRVLETILELARKE